MMKPVLSLFTLSLFILAGPLVPARGLEVPEGQPSRCVTVSHEGYTVSFDPVRRTPAWVAWELTSEETSGAFSRTDVFTPDPAVSGSPESREYSRSGYDRGHMAPAADMKWSERAMAESFYTTNICPQDNGLNAGEWCNLEKQCRVWARHYGKIWIAAGPVYSGETRKTASGIAVPDAFYKVLLKEFRGRMYAIGFVMPNRNVGGDILDWCVSVDEVERLTGLDFFPSLPDDVENAVERTCRPEDWRYYMIPFKD